VVDEKYQVAMKVVVKFSGPVVVGVIGKFILEMVAKWEKWLQNLVGQWWPE
jgi:hypothetical protein